MMPFRQIPAFPRVAGALALLVVGLCVPAAATAQGRFLAEILDDPMPLLHSASQGYLGVNLADVDQEKARELKLKEVRGAVITIVDHDAPAGRIGLRIGDVVLKLNGQTVEGAEQLRRMLREIPSGHKIQLEISRDGQTQNLQAELVDRRLMEREIWNRLGSETDDAPVSPAMGMLSGSGASGMGSIPGGFHMPSSGSTLKVGTVVEPLTSQMASYLGVSSGILVKQVTRKSPAEAAGLKPFDVILRVGSESINTTADWDRALRSNLDHPVSITILREKKTQTVTLDLKHKG